MREWRRIEKRAAAQGARRAGLWMCGMMLAGCAVAASPGPEPAPPLAADSVDDRARPGSPPLVVVPGVLRATGGGAGIAPACVVDQGMVHRAPPNPPPVPMPGRDPQAGSGSVPMPAVCGSLRFLDRPSAIRSLPDSVPLP
jgi:hypothetical protein